MTDLLVVVPVRGGSKRLPGKHARPLAGRTLLQHANDALQAAAIDAPVLLSTDDATVAEQGRALGWSVPFERPAALAADTTPTLPVLMHALDWFRAERDGDPDTVLLLQVTSPLRGAAALRKGVTLLAERAEVDAVVGVRRLGFGPNRVLHEAADGFLAPLDDASEPAPLYIPNGALYLIRCATLRRYATLYPPATVALEMNSLASLDIDTAADWRLAEAALAPLPGEATGGGAAR
jgi:CMP-N,N'-diacetyllegionaminic acid synthase